MEEAIRVNEEDPDGNFVIEVLNAAKWHYVTTEFSISAATDIMSNLYLATNMHCQVLSRRSKNQVIPSTQE